MGGRRRLQRLYLLVVDDDNDIIYSMKSKRWRLVGFGIVAAAILVMEFYLLATSPQRKLKSLGYSKDEVDVILGNIEAGDLHPILEVEYLPELTQILAERAAPADFRLEKLSDYVQIQQKYGFMPQLTVKLANHPGYSADE